MVNVWKLFTPYTKICEFFTGQYIIYIYDKYVTFVLISKLEPLIIFHHHHSDGRLWSQSGFRVAPVQSDANIQLSHWEPNYSHSEFMRFLTSSPATLTRGLRTGVRSITVTIRRTGAVGFHENPRAVDVQPRVLRTKNNAISVMNVKYCDPDPWLVSGWMVLGEYTVSYRYVAFVLPGDQPSPVDDRPLPFVLDVD